MLAWKQAEPREFTIVDATTAEHMGTQAARGWWEALALWFAAHPEHHDRHLDARESTPCPTT